MFNDSFVPGYQEPEPEIKPVNYPIEEDHAFTPDEIEAIERYKEELVKTIDANRAFKKGVEIVSINAISYCLSKMVVLQMAGSALPLVLIIGTTANFITNRDCLDFKMDKDDSGWRLTGMQKLIRGALGFVLVGLQVYSVMGDIMIEEQRSKIFYNALEEKVNEYSRLIEEKDTGGAANILLTMLGMGAVIGVIAKSRF